MTPCPDESALLELLEGVLSGSRREELLAHLDECSACRQLIAAAERRTDSVSGASRHTPFARELTPGANTPVLPPGSRVGRYVLLDRLGAGGMGVVYAAYDPELDRKLALKLIAPRLLDSARAAEYRARLVREAKAMAQLQHPNVISVYDAGTFEGQVFVAMELFRGSTLRAWVEGKPRSWREVRDLFLQAGRGLAAAHAAGLIHRDFKPDNVLVDVQRQVRVLDFGLARPERVEDELQTVNDRIPSPEPIPGGSPGELRQPLTRTGSVLGTPGYIAPEQLHGAEVDARTDQYSFCVSFYEALYGERLFQTKDLRALTALQDAERLPPPPAGSHVPPALRKLLLRGLSHHPDGRFPSMEALLRELEKDPHRVRRRLMAAAAGLALTAGVLGGARALSTAQDRLCAGAERKLAGVWDAPRKQVLRAAFLSTSQPNAEKIWRTVERELDRYTRAWVDERTEDCRATRVRGEQSDEILGLRMLCLDRGLAQLDTLGRVFAEPDTGTLESAIPAVAALPGVRDCADVRALSLRVVQPSSPEQARQVSQARLELAEATALLNAGKEARALEIAKRVTEAARTIAYPPLLSEALLLRGRLERALLDDRRLVEPTLREAIIAAEEGRDDAAAARAWTELTPVVGDWMARPEEGLACGRHAAALIKAAGGDDVLQSELHTKIGYVLSFQGKPAEALAEYRKALALKQERYPPDHPEVAAALINMGRAHSDLAEYEQALQYQRQALTLYESKFGDQHPRVATTLLRMGIALVRLNRIDEAIDLQRRALGILERAFGPSSARAAYAVSALGQSLYVKGDRERARELLARSLAIQEKVFGPDHPSVAVNLSQLGECLLRMGKVDEARSLFQRALRITEQTSGAESLKAAPLHLLLGRAEQAKGRLQPALASFRRAYAIRAQALGAQAPLVADDLTAIGEVQVALGQRGEAVRTLEQALVLRAGPSVTPDDRGRTEFALAQALWGSATERERALTLARAAAQHLGEAGEPALARQQAVQAWLAVRERRAKP